MGLVESFWMGRGRGKAPAKAGTPGIGHRVHASLDPKEIAAIAIAELRAGLDASVGLWTDPRSEDRPLDAETLLATDLGAHPAMLARLHRRPIPQGAERFESGAEACLLAPLWAHGRIVGAAIAVRSRPFDTEEARALEETGTQIGTALRNGWLYEEARAAADRDAVTGLLNHRALGVAIAEALAHAEEEGLVSVVMMDLRDFKRFNDTYGHVVGDEVLKAVARALLLVAGDDALAARYGGDEFALVLPGLGTEDAQGIVFGVRRHLEEVDLGRGEGERVKVGLNAGIATYPLDGRRAIDLVAAADAALYRTKGIDGGQGRASAEERADRDARTMRAFETFDLLIGAIDAKDGYTRRHSEDVTEFALWIAREMGLSEETMRTIRMAARLHDLGKIGVPDEVLRKEGRLTPEEYEMMKRHPRLGELIAGAVPGMEGIVDGLRSHHERWDGGGYPDGLAGEEIPLLGRIVAVSDAFSAMIVDRPYRRGIAWPAALETLQAAAGTQFDPDVVAAFLRAAKGASDTRAA